jgi:hypothetical protein
VLEENTIDIQWDTSLDILLADEYCVVGGTVSTRQNTLCNVIRRITYLQSKRFVAFVRCEIAHYLVPTPGARLVFDPKKFYFPKDEAI